MAGTSAGAKKGWATRKGGGAVSRRDPITSEVLRRHGNLTSVYAKRTRKYLEDTAHRRNPANKRRKRGFGW